jgi:metal-dependent amidase/aminoacylase/carboxypeptidase family protein
MSDHYSRFGNDEHQGRNQQYQSYDRNRGYDRHDDGYDRGHGYGHDSHYLMYLDWAKRIFQNKTWLMLALILLFFAVAVGIWLLS